MPFLEKRKAPGGEEIAKLALELPQGIAEAFGLRFIDQRRGKDTGALTELIQRVFFVRIKVRNLGKTWINKDVVQEKEFLATLLREKLGLRLKYISRSFGAFYPWSLQPAHLRIMPEVPSSDPPGLNRL